MCLIRPQGHPLSVSQLLRFLQPAFSGVLDNSGKAVLYLPKKCFVPPISEFIFLQAVSWRFSFRSATRKCPVSLPRHNMGDHTLAAFALLHAHATEEPNLQFGLQAAVRCKGHQCPIRSDSIKHCPHAKRQPKVGSKQQIQPVPKLGLRAQHH